MTSAYAQAIQKLSIRGDNVLSEPLGLLMVATFDPLIPAASALPPEFVCTALAHTAADVIRYESEG